MVEHGAIVARVREKGCVYISVHGVPYSGTLPGHQV